MSRIANNPVTLPSGVEFKQDGGQISVKGSKGTLHMAANHNVDIKLEDGVITFAASNKSKHARALSGTLRSLVNNMVVGVTEGFERKLQLNGVGYRAKASGKSLNLTLGFSHPVDYTLPEGVTAETPSQTEVVVKGIDKQQVGQIAAEIRAFRPPEPYKGKGVRYADEYVRRKEAKKK
ncbi:MAG: 50S ribosomal protein L6 [Gammaproteobacteria bacterium]|nr:50S ribosomal protein L6 [Gammaproteobacteria bacterium]NND40026.1 50S ribosomal protein L6 [Pseudomonadales bacterium]MBT8150451.1 50S ribosomal protein L6 [Gammaproteobacteria bacterium]NNL11768.1 50S ribosomal protein L6 [Pseudomonadales bacterium]NNM11289.1 50S ribosomal protein L6 [Pseudomonadales bacterium]